MVNDKIFLNVIYMNVLQMENILIGVCGFYVLLFVEEVYNCENEFV